MCYITGGASNIRVKDIGDKLHIETLLLGVDPGTTRTGFGLVKVDHAELIHVEHGVWESSKDTNQPERLCNLYEAISTYLERHKPVAVSIERLFFGRATTQIINIMEARGVILLACRQQHIPSFDYPPQTIKAAIAHGKATKKEIQIAISQYFGLDTLPKPDDAADALAAAICHYQFTQFINVQ